MKDRREEGKMVGRKGRGQEEGMMDEGTNVSEECAGYPSMETNFPGHSKYLPLGRVFSPPR